MNDKQVFEEFYKKLLHSELTLIDIETFVKLRTEIFSKHTLSYIDKIYTEAMSKIYGGLYYV